MTASIPVHRNCAIFAVKISVIAYKFLGLIDEVKLMRRFAPGLVCGKVEVTFAQPRAFEDFAPSFRAIAT
jgi:hypothetical protein